MGFLDELTDINSLPYNRLTIIIGKPGSGKTTLAGTYPKPMLYVTINSDGGGVVLTQYDKDVKVLVLKADTKQAVYYKVMALLEELANTQHPFASVIFDAYSSIEEDLLATFERVKGKQLSLDERGTVGRLMSRMRDKLVDLAQREKEEYVLVSHIKTTDDVDNLTGEKTIKIIPKMTNNNGNILFEKASNVMYCCRKPVRNEDGKVEVKFLTYIGAHPYIDTKLRVKGKMLEKSGLYIENCTYEDIKGLLSGKSLNLVRKVDVVDVPINKLKSDDNDDIDEDKASGGKW